MLVALMYRWISPVVEEALVVPFLSLPGKSLAMETSKPTVADLVDTVLLVEVAEDVLPSTLHSGTMTEWKDMRTGVHILLVLGQH